MSSKIIISIVSAGVDSPEWAELLIKSIRKYTTLPHEIIIIDNGSLPENLTWLRAQKDIRLIENGHNEGHGGAMDHGTILAKGKYVCVLDIDSHVQSEGWDKALVDLYNSNGRSRLIGCVGPDHKPLHPPLFFFEKQFILKHGISFRHIPNVSTDTAQKAYWDIKALGFEVVRLPKGAKVYGCVGDEIWLGEQLLCYHSWYGSRFCHNNPAKRKTELDGYSIEDFLANQAKLFTEPQVREILAFGEQG